jgi:hypothetical protein
MSVAQDEFDRLVNQKEKRLGHPEDRENSENESISPSDADNDSKEDDHSDSDVDRSSSMSKTATYTVPSTIFQANTGPKGVIADAQSFERARKRSIRRTLLNAAGFDRTKWGNELSRPQHEKTSPASSLSEDGEEDFMRRWRESRLRELQKGSRRKNSPSKRVYGSVETVDAVGYLDAVEKVASDTVVVVCIYDPESPLSSIVEDCLITLARKQPTTRFIKLHHEIAEMDHIDAPALLAYKAGDVFATIVDIPRRLPGGRECSSESLEDLLKEYRVF